MNPVTSDANVGKSELTLSLLRRIYGGRLDTSLVYLPQLHAPLVLVRICEPPQRSTVRCLRCILFQYKLLTFDSKDKINSTDVYNTPRPLIKTYLSFYRSKFLSEIKTL